MLIIQGERAAGKTIYLLKMLEDPHTYVVVANVAEKQRLRNLVKVFPDRMDRILTAAEVVFDHAVNGRPHWQQRRLVIDNLEMVVAQIFQSPIFAATTSERPVYLSPYLPETPAKSSQIFTPAAEANRSEDDV